jgi:4-amino-4-deoxy-L-arabinose transferase-like glycosyltransferase
MAQETRRIQIFFIVLIIAATAFFRLWQIRDYVVFLGDEGRDMIVMRNMILEKRPVFLGPTASVGGFYLGPIYYWMAVPFLALFNFDPVGPSVMVALFGIGTVILLLKFLKESIGFWPAALVSLLYATAPLIVRYSRSSWNPNPLPFFALLLIYSTYLGIRKKNIYYFLAAGASFGISIQLHYLAVMLIPVAALIVLLNLNFRKWPQALGLAAAGAFVTFSPFLLFEIKHGFPNFTTILEFVTRETTHGYKTINFIWLISNFGNILLEEITRLKGSVITIVAFWTMAISVALGFIANRKDRDKKLIFSIALVYFVGGLFFLRYYTGQVFDYYFGFMFPAPFIAAGLIYYMLWQKTIGKVLAAAITIVALGYFISQGFYRSPPNKLIDQTENVADFVIEKTNGKPYNFALITDHNSDHAYKYFLEIKGHKPQELETLVTDQLLVVCESKTCAPLGHPIWEIAGFGRAEIDGEWELPDIGIKVIRLTHWPQAPSPAGKPAQKGR